MSNWTGPECATPPGTAPPDPCLDRAPNAGTISGKLFRVERVGCRVGGPLSRRSGPRGKRRVALTFDDGPSAYTSRVVKILDRRHAKGTFFAVGQEVHGRSKVMRKAIKHGHELANHTMHHRFGGVGDMRATSNLIERASGFRPCLYRPPEGRGGLRSRGFKLVTVTKLLRGRYVFKEVR